MVASWWHLSERKECAMKDVCLLMLLYVLFLGSVKTAIPTLGSGTTMATNNTPNTVNKTKEPLHTTTAQAPGSSQEAVVAAQRDEDVGEADDKPVRLSTTLIVVLSVASVLLVIVMVPITMLVIFLHQRKQRR